MSMRKRHVYAPPWAEVNRAFYLDSPSPVLVPEGYRSSDPPAHLSPYAGNVELTLSTMCVARTAKKGRRIQELLEVLWFFAMD